MSSPSFGQRNPESASKVTWVPCGLSCGVRLRVRVKAGQIEIHVMLRKGQTHVPRHFDSSEQQEAIEYFIEQVTVKRGNEKQRRPGDPSPRGQVALDDAQHPPIPDASSSLAREFSCLRDERPCITEAVRKCLWCLSSKALDRLQHEGLPVSQQLTLMDKLSDFLVFAAKAANNGSISAGALVSQSLRQKTLTAATAATPPPQACHDQLLQLKQLSGQSLSAAEHSPADAAGHADLAPLYAPLLAGAGAGRTATEQMDGCPARPSEAGMQELLLAPQHGVLLADCNKLSITAHTAPRSGGEAPGSGAAASIGLLAPGQLLDQLQRLQLLERTSFDGQIRASSAAEEPKRSGSILDSLNNAMASCMGHPAAGNSSSAGPQAATAAGLTEPLARLPSLRSLCFSGTEQTWQATPAAANLAVRSAGMLALVNPAATSSDAMAAATLVTPAVYQLEAPALAGQNVQGHVGSPANNPLLTPAVPCIDRTALTVLKKIGEGGFGEVFIADAPVYGRVVVKLLKAAASYKTQLEPVPPVFMEVQDAWKGNPAADIKREACTLARANHPNVLRFYAVATVGNADDGVEGYIMEHIKGGSMLDLLKLRQTLVHSPLPFWLCCQLGLAICNGLQYLHQLGLVHNDLKLENLLLDASPAVIKAAAAAAEGPDTEVPTVKIADFGLSKFKHGEFVSHCADMLGTINYMAPECVHDPHHVSEKADVWSVGLIFYEFVSKQRVFKGYNPLQIYHALRAGTVQLDMPSGCHPDWAFVIGRCVDPSPSARPTMAELGRLMQRMLDQQQAQHQLGTGHVQQLMQQPIQQHVQQQMQLQLANLLPAAVPAPTPSTQVPWHQQWQPMQGGQLLMQQGAPPPPQSQPSLSPGPPVGRLQQQLQVQQWHLNHGLYGQQQPPVQHMDLTQICDQQLAMQQLAMQQQQQLHAQYRQGPNLGQGRSEQQALLQILQLYGVAPDMQPFTAAADAQLPLF